VLHLYVAHKHTIRSMKDRQLVNKCERHNGLDIILAL